MKVGINVISNIQAGLKNRFWNGQRGFIFCLISLIGLCVLAESPAILRKHYPSKQELVYIINSDQTLGDEVRHPGITILRGHVRLRHKGMFLFCDSAFLNEKLNTFDAFGHVRMKQGDTLTITSNFLYYDGMTEVAKLREDVNMKNRNTTLITDSLDYNRIVDKAYYFEGGTMLDKDNVLTSDWGEYSPNTKIAIFNYNVRLINKKLTLATDTLVYNTKNGIASVKGPSKIDTKQDHIRTNRGWYDTHSGESKLTSRSEITTETGRKLVGDTVFYDRQKAYGEAFGNVVLTDTINKTILTGGYCYYNDKNMNAFATRKALAMDYSQGDTIYMHADTMKLKTYYPRTDSAFREMFAYNKVRIFRKDVQGVCDSLFFSSKDTCLHMYKNPVLWHEGQQILGEEIQAFFNDSTISKAHVIDQALSVERKDSVHYNQVSGKDMTMYFIAGDLKRTDVVGNVRVAFYPQEKDSTMTGFNRSEAGSMNVYTDQKRMKRIVLVTQPIGVLYPMLMIPQDKLYLDNFAWFDYMRPKDRNDLFVWRGKKQGTELKNVGHNEVPLPNREMFSKEKIPKS